MSKCVCYSRNCCSRTINIKIYIICCPVGAALTCMSAARSLLTRFKPPFQADPARQHQQPQSGLKWPGFANKTNTAVKSAGSMPTFPSCPCCGPKIKCFAATFSFAATCSTPSQQLPAQTLFWQNTGSSTTTPQQTQAPVAHTLTPGPYMHKCSAQVVGHSRQQIGL